MKMRIRLHLAGFYGETEEKETVYWGKTDDAIKELAYVEHNNMIYEFVTYEKGEDGYDLEAFFQRVSYLPTNFRPYRVYDYNQTYVPPKCICGSEKVGSPRHSTWCEKYRK